MCHLGLCQRFPSKMIGRKNWIQRIQPKLKKQLARTERPVGEQPFTQEIEKDVVFGREGTKYSTRTERLVDGPKSIQSCVPVSVDFVDKEKAKPGCIPNYVIKKGRSHRARHGKTEEQKEYRVAWNAWKRCCKRVDSRGEHFKGVHDRFLRDQVYRESQLLIGWTEQKCIEMDELAKQDHTYRLSREDFK